MERDLWLPRPEPSDITPVIVDLEDSTPPPIEWLWPDRIPLDAVTMVVGDPGLGKSLLTMDWAARVTRGATWPDGDQLDTPPSRVLLLNAEDRNSLRPRLEAAGADLKRIAVLDAVQTGGHGQSRRPLSLDRDLSAVESALTTCPDCRLLVIDPITAYLHNSNHNEHVRAVMSALAGMAQRHRVAVVAVTHMNKRDGGRAKYRAMGALAFVAAARVVWGVIEDPEGGRQLLLHVKNNLSPRRDGLAYRLRSDEQRAVGVVAWDDDVIEKTMEDILGKSNRFNLSEHNCRVQESFAVDWLRGELSTGPEESTFLSTRAASVNISPWQLHQASRKLDVVKIKSGFLDGWTWKLPEHVGPADLNALEKSIPDELDEIKKWQREQDEAKMQPHNTAAAAATQQATDGVPRRRERAGVFSSGFVGRAIAKAEAELAARSRSATKRRKKRKF